MKYAFRSRAMDCDSPSHSAVGVPVAASKNVLLDSSNVTFMAYAASFALSDVASLPVVYSRCLCCHFYGFQRGVVVFYLSVI